MGNHRADRRGPERAASSTRAPPRRPCRPAGRKAGKHRAARHRSSRTAAVRPDRDRRGRDPRGRRRCRHARPGPASRQRRQPRPLRRVGPRSSTAPTPSASAATRAPRRSAATPTDRRCRAADQKLKASRRRASSPQQRNAALASLRRRAEKRADEIAKNLWVLPTVGYHLTARFGQYGLWSSMPHRPGLRRPHRHPDLRRRQRRRSPTPATTAPTATRPSRRCPTAPRSGTATSPRSASASATR